MSWEGMNPRGRARETAVGQAEQSRVDHEDQDEDAEQRADKPRIEVAVAMKPRLKRSKNPAQDPVQTAGGQPADDPSDHRAEHPAVMVAIHRHQPAQVRNRPAVATPPVTAAAFRIGSTCGPSQT